MNRLFEMLLQADDAVRNNQYNPFRTVERQPVNEYDWAGNSVNNMMNFARNLENLKKYNQVLQGNPQPTPAVAAQQPVQTPVPQAPVTPDYSGNMTPMSQLQQQQKIANSVQPQMNPNMTPMNQLADIQMGQANGMTPVGQVQGGLLDLLTKKTLEDEIGQWSNFLGQSAV